MLSKWESLEFRWSEADIEEPMGSKEKWWVDIPWDDRPWLLKLSRIDDRDQTVSGEDWAEWIVHQLSELIGVPTATVSPAVLEGRRGIVSRSVLRDERESLDNGNSVLAARFSGYDTSVVGENAGYTPEAVKSALRNVGPPLGTDWPTGITGYDVWVGYLVMDAWVAARDRHHENWGVVLRGEERHLAPSFDHGNALGFQERDDRRARMLEDPQHFQRWIRRGSCRYFAGGPNLVDLARQALDFASATARQLWMDRLAAVDDDEVGRVTSIVPTAVMSDVTRRFVTRIQAANRRRLLDGHAGA